MLKKHSPLRFFSLRESSPTIIWVSASRSLPVALDRRRSTKFLWHFMVTPSSVSRFYRRQGHVPLPHFAMGANITAIAGCGSLDFPLQPKAAATSRNLCGSIDNHIIQHLRQK